MKPKRARVPYTVPSPIGYLPLGIRWLHGANLRKASLKQTFKYWRLSTCASTLFCRACDAPTNGKIVSLQFALLASNSQPSHRQGNAHRTWIV